MADYQNTPETKADLPWADLVVLDLSRFEQPDGKQKLAEQLRTANETSGGFFYLINHGLPKDAITQQFELASSIFAQSAEEKNELIVQPGRLGYKPSGSMELMPGIKDNVEIYDDPKYNALNEDFKRPAPCNTPAKETKAFCTFIHNDLLRKLLVLSALSIGRKPEDEEIFVKHHNYEKLSDCHMRYMLHHPRSVDELATIKEMNDPSHSTIPGHTDFGTLTFLFRQPIAGLQIRKAENDWQWVKPLEDSITMNVADCLSYVTGNRMKSSIHRVVLPLEDQRHLARLSVIYTILEAFSEAQQHDTAHATSADAVKLPEGVKTMGEWVAARYKKPFNYKFGKKEEDVTIIAQRK